MDERIRILKTLNNPKNMKNETIKGHLAIMLNRSGIRQDVVNKYVRDPTFLPHAMKRELHVLKWLKRKLKTLAAKNDQLDEEIMSHCSIIIKEHLPLHSLNWQKYRVQWPKCKFADFMIHMKVIEDTHKKSCNFNKKSRSKGKKR